MSSDASSASRARARRSSLQAVVAPPREAPPFADGAIGLAFAFDAWFDEGQAARRLREESCSRADPRARRRGARSSPRSCTSSRGCSARRPGRRRRWCAPPSSAWRTTDGRPTASRRSRSSSRGRGVARARRRAAQRNDVVRRLSIVTAHPSAPSHRRHRSRSRSRSRSAARRARTRARVRRCRRWRTSRGSSARAVVGEPTTHTACLVLRPRSRAGGKSARQCILERRWACSTVHAAGRPWLGGPKEKAGATLRAKTQSDPRPLAPSEARRRASPVRSGAPSAPSSRRTTFGSAARALASLLVFQSLGGIETRHCLLPIEAPLAAARDLNRADRRRLSRCATAARIRATTSRRELHQGSDRRFGRPTDGTADGERGFLQQSSAPPAVPCSMWRNDERSILQSAAQRPGALADAQPGGARARVGVECRRSRRSAAASPAPTPRAICRRGRWAARRRRASPSGGGA